MRIVFMGTPLFAVPALQALLEAGHEIVAVVTTPDKPAGRGLKVQSSPVKQFAQLKGLTILQPTDIKDVGFYQELAALHAELFVVVAFRILPQELIDLPSHGAFNLHASLLPQYRGAAPINWAIIHGEKETGVTTFFLKKRVDTGDILLQRSTAIGPDETAGELHDRLMIMGAQVVVETVQRISSGEAQPIAQPNASSVHAAPKIFPADCELRANLTPEQTHNFIRGLSPQPGAWVPLHDTRLKVVRSARTSRDANPSRLFVDQGRLYLSCAGGCVELTEVQPEGKRRMSGEAFARGLRE